MSTVSKPRLGVVETLSMTTSPDVEFQGDAHDQHGDLVAISPGARACYLAAVLAPFAGLILAIAYLWGYGFNWIILAIFAVMYLLTGFGITVGYHRYFTHRSFDTIWPIKLALAILGSMAVQGPLIRWVAIHRSHHQHSDRDHDPHSPHDGGGHGIWGLCKGFVHAHVGWLFEADRVCIKRYAPDLMRDRAARWMSALFPVWVLLGLLIPTVLGGLLTWSWLGALLGLIWGGLVRIFFVHHVTWSVNSVCHLWGSRPFRTHDESRNNPIFGVFALGEGWHNNHHAFPASARHGLRWWQFDASYAFIRALSFFRLAWNVKAPSHHAIQAKRAQTPSV